MSGLPKGWELSTLGEICSKPQYGWTSKAGKTGKLRYLRTTDISGGNIEWSEVPYCIELPDVPEKYLVQKNDIIVSRAGSVGVSYRIEDVPFDTVFASYLIRFKPLDSIEPKLVEYYLQSDSYWRSISECTAGIAIPNVNASKLAELEVPLPPLNEQRRIVAKLEEVLSKVDASQKRLAWIPVILKRFRQAVLAAACSGRLTADWREKNGAGEGEELPEGWNWIQLDDVLPKGGIFDGPFGSNLKSSDYTDTGAQVIRLENIGHLRFNCEKETFVSLQKYETLRRHTVGENDIIFASFISEEIRACLLPKLAAKAIAKADCFCLRPNNNIDRQYLLYQLVTQESYNHLVEQIHGVTRPRINTKQLRNLPLRICSLPEQQEIVLRVESYFTLADQLEARYHNAKTHIDRLTQSILAKAFRGELVPQDPNDEPASELLERIRTQGDVVTSPKKKKEISETTVPEKHRPHNAEPPLPPVVASFDVKSMSTHARKIYRHMKRNREYSKDEIAVPLILSTSEWNSAIRELKEAGAVVQTGDKRGARYCKQY